MQLTAFGQQKRIAVMVHLTDCASKNPLQGLGHSIALRPIERQQVLTRQHKVNCERLLSGTWSNCWHAEFEVCWVFWGV